MSLDGGVPLLVTKPVTAVNGNAYLHCLQHEDFSRGG